MDVVEARSLLGVRAGAAPLELKHAYRERLKRWHPDRFAADAAEYAEAVRRTQRINAAYMRLAGDVPITEVALDGAEAEWTGRRIRAIEWRWTPLRRVMAGDVPTHVGVLFWLGVWAALVVIALVGSSIGSGV